jgi:hypothetical protein
MNSVLLTRIYPAGPGGVNANRPSRRAWAGAAALAAAVAQLPLPTACHDPGLASLFAPAASDIGHYEVCASPEPLARLADPAWTIDAVQPLDAFGKAGSYNRQRVIRLYGGRRAQVARGWRHLDGRLESITLVSPYPDSTQTRLLPGTLVIRYAIILRQ